MGKKREPSIPRSTEIFGRTALHRVKESLIARMLVQNTLIKGKVFDWGCGHGQDVAYFRKMGLDATGWDPIHRPDHPPSSYEPGTFQWVHCAYVLNVIADPKERLKVLYNIYNFLPSGGYLSLAVRPTAIVEIARKSSWKRHNDGWITTIGTFQKGYKGHELVTLVKKFFAKVHLISSDPVVIIARKK